MFTWMHVLLQVGISFVIKIYLSINRDRIFINIQMPIMQYIVNCNNAQELKDS